MAFTATFYALLQLAVRLAQSAYNDDFDQYSGKVIYSSKVCEISKPVFYIYQQDDALFVAIRGSSAAEDWATDAAITETKGNDSTFFHTGFYDAALYVFETVKQYTKGHTGPVYFTGHSYGASVSQIMHLLQHKEDPSINVTSFAFAPAPAMNLAADDDIRENMYSFVNDDDLIPTLSVPNCYKRFTFLFPTLHDYPSDVIINRVNTLLKIISFTSLLDQGTFNMVWDAVPTIVIAAKEYEVGQPKYVRYVAGTAYRFEIGKPKSLSNAKINQEIFLDTLSISLSCITDHSVANYVTLVDEIIED